MTGRDQVSPSARRLLCPLEAAPYSGTSLYHYDVMARSITYQYRASDGSVSGGVAGPTPNGLSFREEIHHSPDGRETTIRSSWIRDGADAYLVRAEARAGAGWRASCGGCEWSA
jgi:hypothetical protein